MDDFMILVRVSPTRRRNATTTTTTNKGLLPPKMATTNKYDRQLRLWGANGQRSLSEARILLIGSSAVGTETLKNLVLPGIGSFHVMDEDRAMNNGSTSIYKNSSSDNSSDDLMLPSANFFVPKMVDQNHDTDGNDDSMMAIEQKSCAEVACELLAELNEDVKGSFSSVSSLDEVDNFDDIVRKQYTLIIAADLSLRVLRKVAKACWLNSVHLISVKSYGLIGTCRVQVLAQGHHIVESKPSSSVPDLRIWKPFPELITHAETYQMGTLDDMQHGHVPFVIILIKAIQQWQNDHEGKLPLTFKEKEDFKDNYVKAMSRDYSKEVNFEEAIRDAYLAYSPHELPYEMQELLENTSESSITAQSQPLEIMLLALKKFMSEQDGDIPLNGTIPDMTSATDPYIALQEVYHKRSSSDFSKMKEIVNGILDSIGQPKSSILDDEIMTFCKNIFYIQILSTRSFEEEIACSGDDYEEVKGELMVAMMDPYEIPTHTPLLWFLMMRACEFFEEENGVYPGSDSRDLAMASDVDAVMKIGEKLVETMGIDQCDLIISSCTRDHAIEMVRYFNAELHNVASLIGGVASQEAVKVCIMVIML